MSVVQVELESLTSFIIFLSNTCYSFCENQQKIDREYNIIMETWQDKNCYRIGQSLRETGEVIGKFYCDISDAINVVKKYCDKLCRYIDAETIDPKIEEFKIAIREEIFMNGSKIDTNADALRRFKNALDLYIDSIIENVNGLCSKYNAIGESGEWHDEQYERFGDSIFSFKKKMEEEVEELSIISEFLRRKIEILEEN